MRFEHAFALSTRLVALSGLAALALTAEAPFWLTVPAVLLAVSGMVYPERMSRPVLPKKAVAALVVGALGFAVLDFFFIGGSLILAGADFLVVLLCLKLLSLEAEKDYIQMCAVSFFLLLASTGLSTEIYFLAAFLLFFVSLTWALMLLTVKGDSESITGRPPRWRVGRGFFGGTAGLTLGATLLTLMIFFIIPRVGIGFFSKRAGGLIKLSGFSDKVELGSMGRMKLDPTAVMRVELLGRAGMPSGRLYWRGRSFDHYDGASWLDTIGRRRDVLRAPGGVFYTGPRGHRPGRSVRQDITLEPLNSTTIFALYPVEAVTADFRQLSVDLAGSLFLPYPPGGRLRYTAHSSPDNPSSDELSVQGAGLPDDFAENYLQMPEGSEDLAVLAEKTVGDAKTPYEKAVRIGRYLENNYVYSLEPPRDVRASPMDDFLFHAKAGYCEHFATAMALMLRAVGVPARLVSGFSGGEWNGYGGYYVVREQDAHTWVEVYFPESGWVVFDPTPESAAEKPGAFVAGVAGLLDFIKYRWDRYIVFFNLRDQIGAARGVSEAYRKARQGLGDFMDGLKYRLSVEGLARYKVRGGYIPVAVAAFLIASAALYLLLKGAGRRALAGKRSVVPFYEETARVLKKKGAVRRAGLTPMEFARGLAAERGGAYAGVVYVTELYNRVRFGGRPASRAELERVMDILDRLRKTD